LPEVVSSCNRRSHGGVEAIESKRKLVLQFELAGHTPLVWSSSNEQDWGASPFNPWLETVNGKAIFLPEAGLPAHRRGVRKLICLNQPNWKSSSR